MITKLKVAGFRSLRNFEMEIRPGLNVLVGPNGAGKTNIILLFEFIRLVNTFGVRDAISKMGGAGQIFQKRGQAHFVEAITCQIDGIVTANERRYEYSIVLCIKSSSTEQEVFFDKQKVSIKEYGFNEPHIDLAWVRHGDDNPKLELLKYPEQNESTTWSRKDFERFVRPNFFYQSTLVSFLLHADSSASEVSKDLSGRFFLNVIPSVVKSPEDSTRQPGIESDGSGLSATIYALKRNRPIPEITFRGLPRRTSLTSVSWPSVLSLIKVAVPTIEDIDVENDAFENKLTAKITVGRGNLRALLPLSAMSDGTVKWMSLIVRLSTSKTALLLEEPENYLHPLMQREIVRLLRDSMRDDGFVLVSTHSETLINALMVEELVVVSYAKGGTRAKRVANAQELSVEIEKTGFGLGYYYLADAIRS